MTTRTTPTTLGNLEFSDIKTSLTDYLKNQSVFSGYNFEGSALQTIIDLLAYNTFYYAYYANMINAEAFLDSAQKEDSIISLCKPLGYTVPSSTASKALIQVGSMTTTTSIPSGTLFITANSQGKNYNFYNLEDVGVSDGSTEPFYIYEANKYVEFDGLPTFNYTSQKIVIAEENVDLSTVRVTITESNGAGGSITQIWTPVGNIGYTSRVDENIYFIERTSTGFAILFGSTNSVGRSIDSNIEKILIRYLKTSGEEANMLSLFRAPTIPDGVVLLNQESFGGRLALDLDQVRFLAPKWFAAQERAVTVNDYKALLLQSGFFNSENEFNVFGGQDLTPAKYGRVFVSSTLDPLNGNDSLKITQIINFLKERSVVTILPEYVVNSTINLYTDFKFSLGAGTPNTASSRNEVLSLVKSIFDTNYTVSGNYNITFSASDFIATLQENANPKINTLVISPDNFTIYLNEDLVGGKDYLFNLQNELELNTSTYTDITELFESPYVTNSEYTSRKAVLRMFAGTNSAKNTKINLRLFARDPNTGVENEISGDFGYFIANKGVIYINSGVITSGTTANLNVNFARSSFTIGLNNLVSFRYNTVTLI
jgi:hypothetical protein